MGRPQNVEFENMVKFGDIGCFAPQATQCTDQGNIWRGRVHHEFKDLGVTYDSLLLFDKHISDKVNKAYMMLVIIKRNFAHLSRKCFIILYKSLVRSHLEYANSVWYPKRKTDVDKIERV